MIYNIIFICILIILVVVCDYLLLGWRKGKSFEQWETDIMNKDGIRSVLLFLAGLFIVFIIIGLLAIMLIPILLIVFHFIIEFIVWGGDLIKQVLSYWI